MTSHLIFEVSIDGQLRSPVVSRAEVFSLVNQPAWDSNLYSKDCNFNDLRPAVHPLN